MPIITPTVTMRLNKIYRPTAFTVQPSISGGSEVGDVLTFALGTANGYPAPTLTPRVLRNGVYDPAINPLATYTLVDADAGDTLTLSVVPSNSEGSGPAATASVGPITAAVPITPVAIGQYTAVGAGAVEVTAADGTHGQFTVTGGMLTPNTTPLTVGSTTVGSTPVTVEANTYSVATDAELATVMAISAATLAGRTIGLREGDFDFVSAQWSSRAFGSMVTVKSHDPLFRGRFIVAGGTNLAAGSNLTFEDLDFYSPFIVGTSNDNNAALVIKGTTGNQHFRRCRGYSNLSQNIADGVPAHIPMVWYGLFGSDGTTNLNGPQSFENCEFFDAGRVFNLRIGGNGSGTFTFCGNRIHTFSSDAAVFSGRPGARALIAFNQCYNAVIRAQTQFQVVAVDTANNRITLDTDELGAVSASLTMNIGTSTTTPPGGMNLPGVGGGNDYSATILSVSAGQTQLQFSVDITSAGSNVWMNKEPTHTDGFQYIPGTSGGDAEHYEILFNDFFLESPPLVAWPGNIFAEDVAGPSAEGHYRGFLMAMNRGWCGAYTGFGVANPIDCLVAGNSLIRPNNADVDTWISLGSQWAWGGSGNSLISNVTPIMSIDSAVTGTVSVGNILADQSDYPTLGLFAGTGGYQPTTLAEFQLAFTRTDIVGVWDANAYTWDVPLINAATVASFTAATGATAGVLTTSAPVLVSAVTNSEGSASAYGAMVSMFGGLAPELRITANIDGSGVVHDWTTGQQIVEAGQYLWLRDTASTTSGATRTVQAQIGLTRASWDITTAAFTGFGVADSVSTTTGALAFTALEGDLAICAASCASNTARVPTMISSGWTLLGSRFVNATRDENLYVWYKWMGATPDTEVSLTHGGGSDGRAVGVQVWRGVDPTTPFDVAFTVASGTNTRAANPPANTPVTTGAKLLTISAAAYAVPSVDLTADYLSGQLHHKAGGGTYATSLLMGHVDWAGGAYDPAVHVISGSVSGDSWASFTLVLRPAP